MAAWLAGCRFQNLQPKEMAVRKVARKNTTRRDNKNEWASHFKTCAGCNYVKKLMKMMKGDPKSIHVFRFCSPNACHWPWSFGKTRWWRGMSVRWCFGNVILQTKCCLNVHRFDVQTLPLAQFCIPFLMIAFFGAWMMNLEMLLFSQNLRRSNDRIVAY